MIHRGFPLLCVWLIGWETSGRANILQWWRPHFWTTCSVDVRQMHCSNEGRRMFWVILEVFQTLDWLNRVSRAWNRIYGSNVRVCSRQRRYLHITSLTITVAPVSTVTCGALAQEQLSLARHAPCGCVTVMISGVTGVHIFWLGFSSWEKMCRQQNYK